MFITVRLLSGFPKPLLYACPSAWPRISKGTVVHVPVKNSLQPGLVINTHTSLKTTPAFTIKEAYSYDVLPHDPQYFALCEKIARLYYIDKSLLYIRIKQFLAVDRQDTEGEAHAASPSEATLHPLTDEQGQVYRYLAPHITTPQFTPTLLHGVTGSGKTEVYAHLIAHTIAAGKSVLFLSPEVSLSMQFAHIFQTKLPHASVFDFHSASRARHKKDLWQQLLQNTPVLVCGVHLPVLLPLSNLGLIIVDEEHETNYREKRHPKLHSRDIALLRAAHYRIPIILGSATPSAQSFHLAQTHNWRMFRLTKRFRGSFPTIQKVLLTADRRREYFWISYPLQKALRNCLDHGNQAIIYINRRGFSFFIQCSSCGFIAECPHCSVSLTLHKYSSSETLQCHYCGYTTPAPTLCPQCKKSDDDTFLKKGIGTQQIITMLEHLFPTARIQRADLDSTRKKREWQQTLKNFTAGNLDILVGTQTITKGYHFPRVTLVGIIWGDLNLHFPSYTASETTLQQLIQVAGRAGREQNTSRVIVQALQDHPIFDYLNEEDYDQFISQELETRALLKFPPAARFVTVELTHTNEAQLARDARTLHQNFIQHKTSQNITILGPVKPVIYKIKRTHMRHIYLRSTSYSTAFSLLDASNYHTLKSSVHIVP